MSKKKAKAVGVTNLASLDRLPTEARPFSRRLVSPEERKLTLYDLVARGILAPGSTLRCSLRGKQVSAKVTPDGRMKLEGVTYETPSKAGTAAKEIMTNRKLSHVEGVVNGWQVWKSKDQSGRWVTLRDLRTRATSSI